MTRPSCPGPCTRSRSSFGALLSLALLSLLAITSSYANELVSLRGRIVDAESGRALSARLMVVDAQGKRFAAESAHEDGRAIVYEKTRGTSTEHHTTLSAHDFRLSLPAGKYTLEAERGKEYLTARAEIEVEADVPGAKRDEIVLELRRFANLAKRGWFSGETHVHRPLDELPTLVVAEDLNVAFPLLYWETRAFAAPRTAGRIPIEGGRVEKAEDSGQLIEIDAQHVIWPRNTEYEIFSVGDRGHTLGAVFIIGQRELFSKGVPPLTWLRDEVREQGALFELDKHNWPWSLAVAAFLKVDLFELANNHLWRTDFHFRDFGDNAPEYMRVDRGTERGWIDFGFQSYYALLDCGLRMRPTAGTASGVHPVPLGFGRVYVHTGETFSYESWLTALDAGRSFVTTGPLLLVEIDGELPGHVFAPREDDAKRSHRVTGEVLSPWPLTGLEVIRNGEVIRQIDAQPERLESGALRVRFDEKVETRGTAWLAVRAYATPDVPTGSAKGRVRFAHSGPVWIEDPARPLRPRRVEVEYLVDAVEREIARSEAVLPAAALAEYREALAFYRGQLESAR